MNERTAIRLTGRIDANNVSEWDKKIEEAIQDQENVIFDASELQYISSAGLRILMKVAKKGKKVTVKDVSSKVYEIFDVTGFTEILKVEKKLRYIDLSGLQCLGEGMYGAVYRINNEQILKVFYGSNSRQRLEESQKNVRAAFTKGIPTIMPFDIVETDKGYGQVFELLDSYCMSDYIHKNPNRLKEYAQEIAELALLLAHTHFGTGGGGNKISKRYASGRTFFCKGIAGVRRI